SLGSQSASVAAINTGIYSGLQPAKTPLMAIFSTVAWAQRGGTLPITSSGLRLVPVSIFATRSSVGGITGRPSDQPLSMKYSCASQISSGTSTRSACSAAVAINFFLELIFEGIVIRNITTKDTKST